jgi:hypothetical protein
MSARTCPYILDVQWAEKKVCITTRFDDPDDPEPNTRWFTVDEAQKLVAELMDAIKKARGR